MGGGCSGWEATRSPVKMQQACLSFLLLNATVLCSITLALLVFVLPGFKWGFRCGHPLITAPPVLCFCLQHTAAAAGHGRGMSKSLWLPRERVSDQGAEKLHEAQ